VTESAFAEHLNETADKVQSILNANKEWIRRYEKYADLLLSREDALRKLASQFHRYEPLQFYISVSQAKSSASSLRIDVRYMGQTVANLVSKQTGVFLVIDKKTAGANKEYFGYDAVFDSNTLWNDRKDRRAADFRAFFKGYPPRLSGRKNNEEHNIESLLISEFEKQSSIGKMLLGIQPMKYAGKKLRFSMPTPISASNHGKVKYSGPAGGGIDILARTGRGRDTHLCVIEVKDENVASEPPEAASEQAVAYAVFLRELLRSKAGPKWWKVFGYSRELPKSIVINTSLAMPFHAERHETDLANTVLLIGDDAIQCHYIYFKVSIDGQLSEIESSLHQHWNLGQ
jgi:hypothetical protein